MLVGRAVLALGERSRVHASPQDLARHLLTDSAGNEALPAGHCEPDSATVKVTRDSFRDLCMSDDLVPPRDYPVSRESAVPSHFKRLRAFFARSFGLA